MLEFTGNVVKVEETKTYGAKGFRKRGIVLREAKENDKYPNFVPFTLTQDRCDLANDIGPDDKVKVHFVLNGRAWDKGDGSEVRYFCDNQVLKLEIIESANARAANVPSPAVPPDNFSGEEMADDLPF